MPDKPKVMKSRAVVRFQDCDPYGHLYNSKYIDYFMNAREDQLLAHYDMDIYAITRETGLGWVVAMNQIAYFEPAMLMEKVGITSQVIAFNKRAAHIEYRMLRSEFEKVKAVMWTRFVHFDLNKRQPADHAEEHMRLYAEVHAPVDEATFDARMRALRNA